MVAIGSNRNLTKAGRIQDRPSRGSGSSQTTTISVESQILTDGKGRYQPALGGRIYLSGCQFGMGLADCCHS